MEGYKANKITIFIITILYVCTEILLNLKLLDTFGTWSIAQDEIKDLEAMGRFISGIGLGIMLWKIFYKKGFDTVVWILPFMVVGILCMYQAQERLIKYLVDHSTSAERQLSYSMTAIAKSFSRNEIDLKSFEINHDDIAKPEVKAFISIIPSFGILNPTIVAEIRSKSEIIAESYALSIMPSQDQTCDVLIGVHNEIARKFNSDYIKGSRKVKIYNSSYAKNSFREKMIEIGITDPPPPGLDWLSFSKHPSIIKFAKKKIIKEGLSDDFLKHYRVVMDCDQIKKEIFAPQLKKTKNEILKKMLSESSGFDPGGPLYYEGVEAFKLSIVPTIALITSAFFGVFNLISFVTTLFLLTLAFIFRVIKGFLNLSSYCEELIFQKFKNLIFPVVYALIILQVVVFPLNNDNIITSSEAFKKIELNAEQNSVLSATAIFALHWLINAQPKISSIPIPESYPKFMFEGFRKARQMH